MLGMEWAPLAGAVVGLIVGLTGVGGGALMAPILLVGFGIDLGAVVATDLLFATITKLVASGVHAKNNLVDWQISKRLWLGSIPATFVVVALAHSGWLFNGNGTLTALLGGLIIFSGLSLLLGDRAQILQRSRRIASPRSFIKTQAPATVISGGILGGLVTATSIGAGALGAVILRSLYPLRMTPPKLVATDTIHAIPVSLAGGLSYLILGHTNLELLGLLILGSIPAVIVGSQLAAKAPSGIIKTVLGCALLLAGMKLISS